MKFMYLIFDIVFRKLNCNLSIRLYRNSIFLNEDKRLISEVWKKYLILF